MYENIEQFVRDPDWISRIAAANYEKFALALFRYQYQHIPVYQAYVKALGKHPDDIRTLTDIPFLPIHFFKSHQVALHPEKAPLVFESSGTTGTTPSRHFVQQPELYEASFKHHFTAEYGAIEQYVFLCLLPSYLERQHSSLVYMAEALIRLSGKTDSNFYLHDQETLALTLSRLHVQRQPTILLGVTFALIDFATAYPMDIPNTIVMETGGMKGRKEEWTREAVHQLLRTQWRLETVHSEYGMTELLSQAYAPANGRFRPANLMQALIREENDPLSVHTAGSGALNIIDLANIYSCAFIATEDLAVVYDDGTFEVRGRSDHSALRGCSLMAL